MNYLNYQGYQAPSGKAVTPPKVARPPSGAGNTYPGTSQGGPYIGTLPDGYRPGTSPDGWDAGGTYGLVPRGPMPQAGPSSGGGSGGPSNWKYSLDPAIAAAFAMARSQRTAARDRGKRDLLMKSGLWKIAQQLFGGDTAWIETVKNNPFSDMANIANSYEGRLGKINQANEDLNSQNLFFSSTRTGDVLPQIYRQRGQDEYNVEVAVRDSINAIEDAYMQAELQDKIAMAQAEQAGAASAWQNYGYGTGGTDGGGGGGAPTTYGQGSSGWKVGDAPVINGQSPTEPSYAAANGMVYAPRYARQPDWQPIPGTNNYRDSQGNVFNGTGRLVSKVG